MDLNSNINNLNSALLSSFPDVQFIRNNCISAGTLPAAFRGKIWNILLQDCCIEDEEAISWHSNGKELDNHRSLQLDCDALTKKYDMPHIRQDLEDLITLLCLRRNIKYYSILSHLLYPILASPVAGTRALLSSCFYSLCSSFMPILPINTTTTISRTEKNLSSWLHQLMCYHFPLLAIYLDRILPNWEVLREPLLPSEFIDHQIMDNLDSIEKDIGIFNSTNVCSPNNDTTQSTLFSSDRQGIITSQWIYGIFCGCLPVDALLLLWDWAILAQERFAGFYLTISLFGIFENYVRQCTAQQVQQWIHNINTNTNDWYNISTFLPTITREEDSNHSLPTINLSIDEEFPDSEEEDGEQEQEEVDEEADDDDDDDNECLNDEDNSSIGDSPPRNQLNLIGFHEIHNNSNKNNNRKSKNRNLETEFLSHVTIDDRRTSSPPALLKRSTSDGGSTHTSPGGGTGEKPTENTAVAFVRGWIAATVIIINNTPQSFRLKLNELLTLDDSNVHNNNTKTTSATSTTDSEINSNAVNNKNHKSNINNNWNNSIVNIKKGIFGNNKTSSGKVGDKDYQMLAKRPVVSTSRCWSYLSTTTDTIVEVPTQQPCLESLANEVIPSVFIPRRIDTRKATANNMNNTTTTTTSITTNINTSEIINMFITIYSNTLHLLDSDICQPFPLPKNISRNDNNHNDNRHIDYLNYFILDVCDDATERLGYLPRCLKIPSQMLSDAQAMSDILHTIQMIGEDKNIHFCLVGAGAELLWYRHQGQDTLELQLAYDWETAKLNAIAMYLIKSGISHVSSLIGGYTEIVHYLAEEEEKGNNDDIGLHILVGMDTVAVQDLTSQQWVPPRILRKETSTAPAMSPSTSTKSYFLGAKEGFRTALGGVLVDLSHKVEQLGKQRIKKEDDKKMVNVKYQNQNNDIIATTANIITTSEGGADGNPPVAAATAVAAVSNQHEDGIIEDSNTISLSTSTTVDVETVNNQEVLLPSIVNGYTPNVITEDDSVEDELYYQEM